MLNMQAISGFCDYFVIVSGTSLRHVNALAQGIEEDLYNDKIKPRARVLHEDESGWLVLDYQSVVVHIFYKPLRDFYALERLWSDAKRVRIPHTGL